MAELKKTQFSNVNEEIISMEFDNNPNIPTANIVTGKQIGRAHV